MDAERAVGVDPWKSIHICTHCGTAQYLVSDEIQFVCIACGYDKYQVIGVGTRLHAYVALRMRMEAPLAAAMMMQRHEQYGIPIQLKDAVAVAQGGSRFTVRRARLALERQYQFMTRMRKPA